MSEKIKVAIIQVRRDGELCAYPRIYEKRKAEIKYFCDIIPERADQRG